MSNVRAVASRWWLSALGAVLVAGCALIPSVVRLGDGGEGISVANGTTLVVTVVVNGAFTISVPPRTGDILVRTADLPPLPWVIEARTATGRALGSMTVLAGDVAQGSNWAKGKFFRADLECGRLDVWVGAARPKGPRPDPEALESWER